MSETSRNCNYFILVHLIKLLYFEHPSYISLIFLHICTVYIFLEELKFVKVHYEEMFIFYATRKIDNSVDST